MEQMLADVALNDCWCYYSTAFFITSNYDALLKLAQFSCQNDKIFGFNLAAEDTTKREKERIAQILEYTDIIFCNKAEALDFSRQMATELDIEPSPINELEIADIDLELSRISEALVKYQKTN